MVDLLRGRRRTVTVPRDRYSPLSDAQFDPRGTGDFGWMYVGGDPSYIEIGEGGAGPGGHPDQVLFGADLVMHDADYVIHTVVEEPPPEEPPLPEDIVMAGTDPVVDDGDQHVIYVAAANPVANEAGAFIVNGAGDTVIHGG